MLINFFFAKLNNISDDNFFYLLGALKL